MKFIRDLLIADAMNVWKNSESKGFTWKSKKLDIHPLEPMPDHVNSHAVMVTNVPSDLSLEMLCLFFESSKASGGGKIEHIIHDKGSPQGLIIFADQYGDWIFPPCSRCLWYTFVAIYLYKAFLTFASC